MALILHLTDLHLGPDGDIQTLGDYKMKLVPMGERLKRIAVLESTLTALAKNLTAENKKLDALIISGDITMLNSEAGFKMLQPLIDKLGDRIPAKNNIIVVPGNHDVQWATPPSTKERYEHFLSYIRGGGFTTPLLDGVDFGTAVAGAPKYSDHYILDTLSGYFVVPINSSNYCGSMEPIDPITEKEWEELPGLIAAPNKDAVKKIFRDLRTYDVPRISPEQFACLGQLVSHIEDQIAASGQNANEFMRVAVIHHQLLPVSEIEEFKAFESIINLGTLRNFLSAHKFDLVLHGHKHYNFTYWDHIYDGDGARSEPHNILVMSGATVGGIDYTKSSVARLIELHPDKFAPCITTSSVSGVAPGAKFQDSAQCSFNLWDETKTSDSESVRTVTGRTAQAVYSRLLHHFKDVDQINYLVCEIEDPVNAERIPDGYPEMPGVSLADRQSWFTEILAWWQKEKTSLTGRSYFTHGNRIRMFPATGCGARNVIDQIDRVCNVLKARPNSSRGVVSLFNPQTDDIANDLQQFPSFCFVQFLVRSREGNKYLDCIGYFRKHEIKYWWPVNVAELALLQSQVVARLPGIRVGRIVTVSTIAIAEDLVPRVHIPKIDQTFDDDVDFLWSLTYSLFWNDMPDRLDMKTKWHELLMELVPSEMRHRDGPPIALNGLQQLALNLRQFAIHHGSIATDLAEMFDELYRLNEDMADSTQSASPSDYKDWRDKVSSKIRGILGRVDKQFEPKCAD